MQLEINVCANFHTNTTDHVTRQPEEQRDKQKMTSGFQHYKIFRREYTPSKLSRARSIGDIKNSSLFSNNEISTQAFSVTRVCYTPT